MARGAGIPARGIVRDEITSSLDLYAILAKEAGFEVPETADSNLPAALGGQARRYAISKKVFRGPTFVPSTMFLPTDLNLWAMVCSPTSL